MSAIRDCILIAGDEMDGTSRAGIDATALAELGAMEKRLAALEAFALNFSDTVECDLANEEAHGKGGMRVTLTGDFVRLPPFAKSRLRWWAERAKEALGEVRKEAKTVQRGEDTVRVYEVWKRNPDGSATTRLECAECGHVFYQSLEAK